MDFIRLGNFNAESTPWPTLFENCTTLALRPAAHSANARHSTTHHYWCYALGQSYIWNPGNADNAGIYQPFAMDAALHQYSLRLLAPWRFYTGFKLQRSTLHSGQYCTRDNITPLLWHIVASKPHTIETMIPLDTYNRDQFQHGCHFPIELPDAEVGKSAGFTCRRSGYMLLGSQIRQ